MDWGNRKIVFYLFLFAIRKKSSVVMGRGGSVLAMLETERFVWAETTLTAGCFFLDSNP